MTSPLFPQPLDDHFPDATPEALDGIAERMQKAIEALFAVKAEAAEYSQAAKLPEDVERVLAAAAHTESEPSVPLDRRLYLPTPDGWQVRVQSGPREYCYYRNPGEDWFHLLIDGELFLQFGDEKVCLNCAVRHDILTDNRLFWQSGRHGRKPLDDSDAADQS